MLLDAAHTKMLMGTGGFVFGFVFLPLGLSFNLCKKRFARAAGSKNNIQKWGNEFGDLKDAFFCLRLHEASQKIFAFEYESPKTREKLSSHGVLPQGYENSPTIFGEQLAKDLESREPPPGKGQLLQYVDDLLIATQTQETCVDWTELGIALGILAQNLGPYQRAVACLSKQLDTAAKGWPSGSTGEPVIHECLETIEATYSSRQDLKDTPLEDAETCLLMEAAMSSVEEDMLAAPVSVAESDILSVGSAFGCANSICASRQSLGYLPTPTTYTKTGHLYCDPISLNYFVPLSPQKVECVKKREEAARDNAPNPPSCSLYFCTREPKTVIFPPVIS
ncbi:hypothetical protein DUI87_06291 [Hirundo rustica rustica]|uniref:ribonuclease H n=1 Tax=Hirundo rustica rustica TaxID=333673 RepID=A0A3M0KV52_HIRRU|nr:hypothetical protein DUI87_06291 [Hirundo rustica rustica]